ncbi:MAG: aldose epimerase family protein [Litorimonas sp.]
MTQSGCSDKPTPLTAEPAPLNAAAAQASAPDPFAPIVQRSASGLEATWIAHGAHLVSVRLPDGTPVLAGFSEPRLYADDHPYVGSLIGRTANRIRGAAFEVDGQAVSVAATEGANALHGGPDGFDAQVWEVDRDGEALMFRHTSPAGHQGYPGNLDVLVRAELDVRELRLSLIAWTDAPTPVNLTQHGYWNPTGLFIQPVDGLVLQSPADRVVAVDAALLPTGGTPSVERSPFDFRQARPIGAAPLDATLLVPGEGLREMASLTDGTRTLTLLSDYPGFQIYTGEALGTMDGFVARGGLALEPQYAPDAVNRPVDGQDTILRPGEVYRHNIVYRFDGLGFEAEETEAP